MTSSICPRTILSVPRLPAGLRTSAVHVAPAHGLTLLAVDYPADAELARRAELTRAHRPAGPGGTS